MRFPMEKNGGNSRRRRLTCKLVKKISISRKTKTAITITKSTRPDPDLDIGSFTYDISHIPESLLLEILSRLPVDSIFRYKCVSKYWFSLISHSYFSKLCISRKLNLSSCPFKILYRYVYVTTFSDVLDRLRPDVYMSPKFSVLFLSTNEEQQQSDQFKVLAISNGLMLCCSVGPLVYYVCDPVTRKSVKLPNAVAPNAPVRNQNFCCEGFVSKMDEENVVTSYKVVRVVWREEALNFLDLECFSSESGDWSDYRLYCEKPIRLPKRGGGPIHFNGALHWFVYDHGMVAFDPYKDTKSCRLIQFPEDRDVASEYKHDGLYRLCDESNGKLRYFQVAPQSSEYYCFSMWLLKDYEAGEWCTEFKVTRSDFWSNDQELSNCLMTSTFVPLSFHPFDLNIVYLRCGKRRSCVVSYNVLTRRLDIVCRPIGVVGDLSWRVVVPFVLPMWPTPLHLLSKKAISDS